MVNTSDCVGKSSKDAPSASLCKPLQASASIFSHAEDLFSYVARELGWKEVESDSKQPSIFCVMQSADLQKRLSRLGPGSWISRYPGAPDVCDKGNFARHWVEI